MGEPRKGEKEAILTPEEVEGILQRLCGYTTAEEHKEWRERWKEEPDWQPPDRVAEVKWDYFNEQPLVTEDIKLQYTSSMTDPVALWRRQSLSGYYGHVQETKVLIILGTDEGLGIPTILTGETFKDIATQIQGDEHWKLVWSLLPLVILDHLSDDCHEC